MSELRPWIRGGASRQVRAGLRSAQREEPSPQAVDQAVFAAVRFWDPVSTLAEHEQGRRASVRAPRRWRAHALVSAAPAAKLLAFTLLVGAAVGGAALVRWQRRNVAAMLATVEPAHGLEDGPFEPFPLVAPIDMPAFAACERDIRPPQAVTPRRSSPSSATSVADEVRVLERARRAIANSDPAAALGQLARYQRSFHAPVLVPEALYLRMEALMLSGDHPSALQTAQTIVAQYPTDPHAARARALLAIGAR